MFSCSFALSICICIRLSVYVSNFNQLLHVLLILMQNHRITGILLQLFCKISTTLTNMKCMDYKIMLISFQIRNEGIRSIVGAFHWPCFDRTNLGAGIFRQNSRQNPVGV